MALFDSGTLLANVQQTDTFNTWRLRTNEINTQVAGFASNNTFTGALNTFNNAVAFKGLVTAAAVTANTAVFSGPVTVPSIAANTITAGGSTVLTASDIGVTVQGYDATLLESSDIGSTVQAYSTAYLNDADIGVTIQAYDATLLNDADIGVTVQGYDAGLSFLDSLNFTDEATFKAAVNLEIGTDVIGYVAPGTSGNILVSNGSSWISSTASGAGGTIEATVAGSISDGDPVIVNANGTVSVVTGNNQVVGSPKDTNLVSRTGDPSIAISYDASADRIIVSYRDNSNGSSSIIGTTSGTSVSFGSAQNNGQSQDTNASIYYPNQNATFLCDGNRADVDAVTISGSTISNIDSTGISGFSSSDFISAAVYDSQDDVVVVSGRESTSGSSRLALAALSYNGTTFSQGTAVTVAGNVTGVTPGEVSLAFDPTSGYTLVFFMDGTSPDAVFYSCSGTTISAVNTNLRVPATAAISDPRVVYDTVNDKFIFYYIDTGTNFPMISIAKRYGTNLVYEAPVVVSAEACTDLKIGYNPTAGRAVVAYRNTSTGYLYLHDVLASGNTPRISSRVNISNSQVIRTGNFTDIGYNSTTGQSLISYALDSDNNVFVALYEPENGNLTTENFIGFSDGSYSNGATALIAVAGNIDDAQTGLTPGQKYYLKYDGSISTKPALQIIEAGKALSSTNLLVKG